MYFRASLAHFLRYEVNYKSSELMMSADKPKNIAEYKVWLNKYLEVEISERTRTYYEAVLSKAVGNFRATQFWQTLQDELDQIKQQYFLNTKYALFAESNFPELYSKSFDSFFIKTFRQNILNNMNWPEPPKDGWFLPENWLSRINDTVRTYFVVKYLDGVNFLVTQLTERGKTAGYDCRVDFEAKEEGYYAAHFYINFPCEIPRENWDTKDVVISVEIQITTQLQEVIRRLLHKHYEQRRVDFLPSDVKWQWDYTCEEFGANYLGHILHYVEGMIMEVRDKQIGEEN